MQSWGGVGGGGRLILNLYQARHRLKFDRFDRNVATEMQKLPVILPEINYTHQNQDKKHFRAMEQG